MHVVAGLCHESVATTEIASHCRAPMGTENPGRPNFTTRPTTTPFAAPPQTMTPFSSSGPVAGPEASGFRPPPPVSQQTPLSSSGPVVGSNASTFRPTPPVAPQTTAPFSSFGPAVGPQPSPFRPSTPARFNDPSVPPPPTTNVPPTAGPFSRFPTPHYPSTPQFPLTAPPPPSRPPPMGQLPFQPPAGQPPFQRPQQQMPSVQMGSPPQSISSAPPIVGVHQSPSDSSFPAPLPNSQTSFPGYARKQVSADSQGPPTQSPFLTPQGGYGAPPIASSPFASQQGGYVPPPPVAGPHHMQHPGSGPPLGGVQALTEDFSSLSIGSVPGSIEPGIDPKALPRPLGGDVEPKSLAQMYPMNCNPRFLRLTTGAIPSSQSLSSRWHLPLGAVVCPLAESPDGVSDLMLLASE